MNELNTVEVNSMEPEISYFTLETTVTDEVDFDGKPATSLKLVTEKKKVFLPQTEVTQRDIAHLLQEESKYLNSELPSLNLKTELDISNNINETRQTIIRRFKSRLMAASNLIAVESRYGPATTVIINPNTANVFDLEGDFIYDLEIVRNEHIKDNVVYVLRKPKVLENDFHEAGYYIFKYNNCSTIAKIGYFPQKTLQKIILE